MFRGDDSVEAEVAAEQLHEYLLNSVAWMKADVKARSRRSK
jgi:hypothetical protein